MRRPVLVINNNRFKKGKGGRETEQDQTGNKHQFYCLNQKVSFLDACLFFKEIKMFAFLNHWNTYFMYNETALSNNIKEA